MGEAGVGLPNFAGVGCSLHCSASRLSMLGSVNGTGLCLSSLRVHRPFLSIQGIIAAVVFLQSVFREENTGAFPSGIV